MSNDETKLNSIRSVFELLFKRPISKTKKNEIKDLFESMKNFRYPVYKNTIRLVDEYKKWGFDENEPEILPTEKSNGNFNSNNR